MASISFEQLATPESWPEQALGQMAFVSGHANFSEVQAQAMCRQIELIAQRSQSQTDQVQTQLSATQAELFRLTVMQTQTTQFMQHMQAQLELIHEAIEGEDTPHAGRKGKPRRGLEERKRLMRSRLRQSSETTPQGEARLGESTKSQKTISKYPSDWQILEECRIAPTMPGIPLQENAEVCDEPELPLNDNAPEEQKNNPSKIDIVRHHQIEMQSASNKGCQSELGSAKRRISELEEHVENSKQVIAKIEDERNQAEVQISFLMERNAAFERETSKSKEQCALLDTQVISKAERIVTLEADLEHMQIENKLSVERNCSLEAELKVATERFTSLEADREQLQREKKLLTERILSLETEVAKAAQCVSTMQMEKADTVAKEDAEFKAELKAWKLAELAENRPRKATKVIDLKPLRCGFNMVVQVINNMGSKVTVADNTASITAKFDGDEFSTLKVGMLIHISKSFVTMQRGFMLLHVGKDLAAIVQSPPSRCHNMSSIEYELR